MYVAHNAYMSSQPLPYRTGYTFVGWYYDRNYTRPFYYLNDRITGDTILYAKWNQDITSYVISFESNGGSVVNNIRVNPGYQIIQSDLPIPSRTNYNFTYWYIDKAQTKIAGGEYVYSNMTLYAGWEPVRKTTHTVYFNSNGGSSVANKTVTDGTVLYQSDLPKPSKMGANFDGWYEDPYCTIIGGAIKVESDITLYAGWNPTRTVTHTVYFNTNGGSSIDPIQVNDGDTINRRGIPSTTKLGFDFTGWYSDSNCYYGYNFSNPIYADVTLYAGWQEIDNNRTIYFNSMGGSNIPTITVQYGGVPNLPTPTRNGFTFNGWYTDINCYYRYNSEPVYNDITLYAGWKENAPVPVSKTYNVMLFTNGGYFDHTQIYFGGTLASIQNMSAGSYQATFEKGTNVGEPEAPVQNGLKFEGWYMDPGFSNPYYGGTISGNMSLYAKWTASFAGSVFDNGGLIAAIAGGVILVGGGIAAAVVVNKKKKNK
jgi:uncharacterized repeat protein (TIGR02543 family)